MKPLLQITAVLEAATGAALVTAPATVVQILLGAPLDARAGLAIGRVAGLALLTIAIACWGASKDVRSGAARGTLIAMLFYNGSVAVLFTVLRFSEGMTGVGLWPAIALHAAFAVWCARCLAAR
jgi:hypothetical protein